MPDQTRRLRLWLEIAVIFIGIPPLIMLAGQRWLMLVALWLGAAFAVVAMKKLQGFNHRREWNLAGVKAGIAPVLARFIILSLFLLIFTAWHDPERLFSFPRERPVVWAAVMLLYPVLSVWPQELLFRSFLSWRYGSLFPGPQAYAIASAILFGYAHILFLNWIAIVFSAAGGLMFAHTYRRHKSLALACLEHALYGCLVFTLGLGWYFYGKAWVRA